MPKVIKVIEKKLGLNYFEKKTSFIFLKVLCEWFQQYYVIL